jgi:hypothetical protein
MRRRAQPLAKAGCVLSFDHAMSLFEVALSLAVAALVGFQVWLTRRVFRSTMFERKQKIWQAQLIWLLPIIGATLVFAVLQEERSQNRPSSHLKS